MEIAVEDDMRQTRRLFDTAFTAVNPANVRHNVVTLMQTPFQKPSPYPMGRPPVRYPDVTTMAGFLQDPAQDAADVRNVLETEALQSRLRDPMPAFWGWDAVGQAAFQTNDKGDDDFLPRAQVLERMLLPPRVERPVMMW